MDSLHHSYDHRKRVEATAFRTCNCLHEIDILDYEEVMEAEVLKGAAKEEVDIKERCSILEVANDPGDEFVSIARARVGIGVVTALHCLKGVAERYLIVSGVGRVELGGQDPIEVAEGDVVRIPPDTPQRIANIGTGDLVFYCICTPPFHPNCYQALE